MLYFWFTLSKTCLNIKNLIYEIIKDKNSIIYHKKIYLQGVVVYELGYILAKKHNYNDLILYFKKMMDSHSFNEVYISCNKKEFDCN